MDHQPLSVAALASLQDASPDDIRSQWNRILDRIQDAEPRIQALLPEDEVGAGTGTARRLRILAQLEELLAQYTDAEDRPPLFAVPVGIKDLFRTTGFPTRAGSKLPPETFEGPEATSVRRLREAGAIVIGKTVTTEFAYFSPGPTRNPWNPDYTPGGSSSGSAAAVSAGYCPFALGTQTIGSVNRPASFCGVVGYKPSYGRISTEGVIPFSASADHVGILAADVASAAAAAAVISDSWSQALIRSGDQRHLILADDAYSAQADGEMRRAIADLAERLPDGWAVERGEIFTSIETLNEAHNRMIAREFADVHEEWFGRYGDLYSERSAKLIELGRTVSDEELEATRMGRIELREQLTAMMAESGVVAILTPSGPGAAPEGLGATGSPLLNLPWTYAGLPTVTLPFACARNGLPLGAQLVGRFDNDESLLVIAAELERRIGFASA
jgi:Asp-tRNA(Asn)/Glu-tRNA(Gln) amidotransferase A subunit family amidase